MRIRSIKPEFWRSEDIAALSREHRLLFIGLWSYVDDNGVGRDDHRLIAADLFPLDDPAETQTFVRDGLATLSRGSLIVRYEVSGRRYVAITGWHHQRVDKPGRPRYPEPTSEQLAEPVSSRNGVARESVATLSRECRDTLAPVTGEQGNRGTETASATADAVTNTDDGFADFWTAYPRKVKRQDAEKAWRQVLRRKADPAQVIAAAKTHAARWRAQAKETEFIPYPASWLRGGSYDDEITDPDTIAHRDVWTVPDDQLSDADVEEILGPGRPPEPPDEFEFWDRDRRHAWNRENYRRWQATRRQQAIRVRADRLARVTSLDDHRRGAG